jgi:DNA-binding transcriptional LysR family regulator
MSLQTEPSAVELRHLRYFMAVYEELHFRRAAERLYMSQPPLSQAISKLERELGVRLFERSARHVEPTAAGRALAEEARTVLADFEAAVREARRAGGVTYPVRVGHSVYLPPSGLLCFREALERRQPGIDLEFSHLPSIDLVDRLRSDELDLGIFPDHPLPEDLEKATLFAGDPMVACLRSGHPLAERDLLTPADVEDIPLVVPEKRFAPVYEHLLRDLQGLGYGFSKIVEAGGTHVRDFMLGLATGDGIGILPPSYFKDFPLVVGRRLDPTPMGPDTVLAWQSQRVSVPNGAGGLRALAQELRGG